MEGIPKGLSLSLALSFSFAPQCQLFSFKLLSAFLHSPTILIIILRRIDSAIPPPPDPSPDNWRGDVDYVMEGGEGRRGWVDPFSPDLMVVSPDQTKGA